MTDDIQEALEGLEEFMRWNSYEPFYQPSAAFHKETLLHLSTVREWVETNFEVWWQNQGEKWGVVKKLEAEIARLKDTIREQDAEILDVRQQHGEALREIARLEDTIWEQDVEILDVRQQYGEALGEIGRLREEVILYREAYWAGRSEALSPEKKPKGEVCKTCGGSEEVTVQWKLTNGGVGLEKDQPCPTCKGETEGEPG